MSASFFDILVIAAVALPAALLVALGGTSLLSRPLGERLTGALMRLVFTAVAGLLITATALSVPREAARRVISVGEWFSIGGHAFALHLFADPLSLIFATMCAVLVGVVAAFAHIYLHRDPGYNRFFVCLALFNLGVMLIALGGSIEVIFAGWEMVGLSSALLIAFFHERPEPVKNGFWTLAVYRTTDLGLLGAALLVHHFVDSGDLGVFLGPGWPDGPSPLSTEQATLVGVLLLFSVLGKGAQLPFSSWLPRAMEGPTPSSAIFYGALSIHAGAFLLLRMAPLLDRAPLVAALVVAFGLGTAVHATMVGRTQTDIKTALAYASLTQVGIILAEIGIGLRWIPLLHMLGHISVRSLQLLRSPSLLHDFHRLETAVGGHLPRTGAHLERLVPERLRKRLYVAALERWYLDGFLLRIIAPVVALLRRLDRAERRLCALLGGAPPTKPPEHRDD